VKTQTGPHKTSTAPHAARGFDIAGLIEYEQSTTGVRLEWVSEGFFPGRGQ